jgi:hypothetical protein
MVYGLWSMVYGPPCCSPEPMEGLEDQLQLTHVPRHPQRHSGGALQPHVHQHVPARAREGGSKGMQAWYNGSNIRPLSMVYGPWSMVYDSMVYGLWSTRRGARQDEGGNGTDWGLTGKFCSNVPACPANPVNFDRNLPSGKFNPLGSKLRGQNTPCHA